MTAEPRPVLLLHAFPLSRAMWDDVVPLQGAGRRTVAHDLPGFGGATGAIASLAEAAEWIFDRLPPGTVDAVGLSMGGYLLLELLAQAPDRFGKLVFANTTARADTDEKKLAREAQAHRALEAGLGELIASVRADHAANPVTADRAAQLAALATPEGVAGALHAMAARPDRRDLLRRLDHPVLALGGSRDTITPPERLREIAELARGEYVEIEDAGHLSALDRPGDFARAVLDFLG